ncbi:hypothetical protein BU24DRAFT_231980 [Aaosphaeria arxii CBS 175.79]|uniref:D-isomer specific 2-hydroxyacid dehydrogenase NAD-binding domain-containing protein n=1 Tax=Aaosphaeria arxii CBS 175.79 TaxID=1450172 RepID=A0A6A5XIV9_9PLEO|nr:uncharacterized protein BU24DRAFT_231980 [Aaosphaeria arxii CBS 175.79]KAF2013198.1 hypothetical protein BU24DRAFT_231980 [Aaosphaeria arxii CBS 175.79]
MVAMGGGPETPQRSTGDGEGSRDLLLAVLPWPESEPQHTIAKIKEDFPNLDVHYVQDYLNKADRGKTNVPEELYKRAKYLATLSWLPPTPDVVPDLKFIQFFSAGSNHVANHPIYTDSKIPLTTASGIHGPQIAEWVIMMDLVHSHKYIDLYEDQKKKEWSQPRGFGVRDAVGKTVGVLGYGSIGRQVARVAKAMGSNVIAFTASPRRTPESKKDNGFIVPGTGDPDGSIPSAWYSGLDKESLHEFLKQRVDLLVLSVPLTKETTHFIAADEFAILEESNPHGTFIANISRGGIINQPDLIKALETKQIRGAALDVTDPEPLPKDDPLWDAPNVLITPHISGSSVAYADRAFQVLHENLRRDRDGVPLCNLIDRKRGY